MVNRRVIAADFTIAAPINLDRVGLAPQSIQDQQAPDERLADARQNFDHFKRLPASDTAHECAQYTCLDA